MKIAGVRLLDGRVVWLDAGHTAVAPLDHVTAWMDGSTSQGEVFLAPHQMLTAPEHIDGMLTRVIPRSPVEAECDRLPGAELPALAQRVAWDGMPAGVVALDPVGRRVTIVLVDGTERIVPLEELSDG